MLGVTAFAAEVLKAATSPSGKSTNKQLQS